MLWGGTLGAVLLAWSVVMVLAPELGSILAVFGSPILAWFVIVRLLTPQKSSAGRAGVRSPGERQGRG